MSKKRLLNPIPLFDESSVFALLDSHNIKHIHAEIIWKYLLKQNKSFLNPTQVNESQQAKQLREESIWQQILTDLPQLPPRCVELLCKNCVIESSRVVQQTTSNDGTTTKLLI